MSKLIFNGKDTEEKSVFFVIRKNSILKKKIL